MKITKPWKPELGENEAEIIRCIKNGVLARIQEERRGEEAKERRRKEGETLLELLGIKKKRDEER